MKGTATDITRSSPEDKPNSESSAARRLGNGILSLIDFVVTFGEFSFFVLGLLFALLLGGLVVGALTGLLTGNAHQGLVVGVVLTCWTCLVMGTAALAARGRRQLGGRADPPHTDGNAAARSRPDPNGLGALVREGASLVARAVGLAAICALAPVIAAGVLTGSVLTAVAVGIVAFPVVLAQGLVVIKVES